MPLSGNNAAENKQNQTLLPRRLYEGEKNKINACTGAHAHPPTCSRTVSAVVFLIWRQQNAFKYKLSGGTLFSLPLRLKRTLLPPLALSLALLSVLPPF